MKRTKMKEVRELLRLSIKQGFSNRRSAQMVGISKSSGSEYIAGFKASGFSIDSIESLSNTDGVQLIGLAGMNYASEVEAKGYNVISVQADLILVDLERLYKQLENKYK